MSLLQLKQVSKDYKSNKTHVVQVLKDIDLNVEPRKFVVFLGPSGVGKSTLLNLIAGFESPSHGEILFDGKKVCTNISGLSVVFQQPALLPWRTVLQNVMLPLEIEFGSTAEAVEQAKQALISVGLKEFENSYPHSLSGGMRSRVAIARAMIQKPRLLLMDEPFANLDPIMRETFDINLMRFCHKREVTGVFVTHSVEEACLLAHTIYILDGGRIVESVEVPLSWPRSRETTASAEYLEVVRHVRLTLLKTSMANLMPQPRYIKDKDVFVDALDDEDIDVDETQSHGGLL